MRIGIVSNLRERKGLWKDASILQELLCSWDHEALPYDFREDLETVRPADLLIFCEGYWPRFFDFAPRRWIFPNPEWWTEDHSQALRAGAFDAVCCKTMYAIERLLDYELEAGEDPRKAGKLLAYTGFMSMDRLNMTIPRKDAFMHAPGGSAEKGTEAIPEDLLPRIYMANGKLDEAVYLYQQNRCRFHLCPSKTEGWGHYLHEALSVGAIIITTNARPMRDMVPHAVFVEPVEMGKLRLADIARVDGAGIRKAIEACLEMDECERAVHSRLSRALYEKETEDFKRRFKELITGV